MLHRMLTLRSAAPDHALQFCVNALRYESEAACRFVRVDQVLLWLCSGQDSAREAREGQRGGEPHSADGAEGTDHRKGITLLD